LAKVSSRFIPTNSETLEYHKYLPPWLTPEFLYRINYGPITHADREKVQDYLIRQYSALEVRRRYKTIKHLRRRQWRLFVPYPWGQLPIRKVVREASSDDELSYMNSSVASFQPLVMIGFLDPKLAHLLKKAIYPFREYNLKDFYEDFKYEEEGAVITRASLELELSLVRPRMADSHLSYLLPFAAVIADMKRLIESINVARFTYRGVSEPLGLSIQEALHSQSYYISGSYFFRCDERLENLHFISVMLRSRLSCGPELDPLDGDFMEIKPILLNVDDFRESEENGEKELAKRLDNLTLDWSSINAGFLCSGPFKLMMTTVLENHFVLDQEGYLQVYWDFEPVPGARLKALEGHFFWDYSSDNTR
jgi:hypothetical protein